MVFVGQVHMYLQYRSVSRLVEGLLYYRKGSEELRVYFYVSVLIGYMVWVSCYSIFSIKIIGFYGFYKHKTDPVTFLTFVMYMSKLTYPLCYTTLYIMLGNTDRIESTSFYRTIGNLKPVPILGYDFNRYLPFLFIILTVLFMFDCFARLLEPFGFVFYSRGSKAS